MAATIQKGENYIGVGEKGRGRKGELLGSWRGSHMNFIIYLDMHTNQP